MAHVPVDSRLLKNLIADDDEYHKHLLVLLDAYGRHSLLSLSAYAATSPAPVARAVIGVAGDIAGADDALRRYAASVHSWTTELRALEVVEEEMGRAVRDREVLVTRLLEQSRSRSSTQVSPSTSRVDVVEAELRESESKLSAKKRRLDDARTGALRRGLEGRCKAMVECGQTWSELGHAGLRLLEGIEAVEDAEGGKIYEPAYSKTVQSFTVQPANPGQSSVAVPAQVPIPQPAVKIISPIPARLEDHASIASMTPSPVSPNAPVSSSSSHRPQAQQPKRRRPAHTSEAVSVVIPRPTAVHITTPILTPSIPTSSSSSDSLGPGPSVLGGILRDQTHWRAGAEDRAAEDITQKQMIDTARKEGRMTGYREGLRMGHPMNFGSSDLRPIPPRSPTLSPRPGPLRPRNAVRPDSPRPFIVAQSSQPALPFPFPQTRSHDLRSYHSRSSSDNDIRRLPPPSASPRPGPLDPYSLGRTPFYRIPGQAVTRRPSTRSLDDSESWTIVSSRPSSPPVRRVSFNTPMRKERGVRTFIRSLTSVFRADEQKSTMTTSSSRNTSRTPLMNQYLFNAPMPLPVPLDASPVLRPNHDYFAEAWPPPTPLRKEVASLPRRDRSTSRAPSSVSKPSNFSHAASGYTTRTNHSAYSANSVQSNIDRMNTRYAPPWPPRVPSTTRGAREERGSGPQVRRPVSSNGWREPRAGDGGGGSDGGRHGSIPVIPPIPLEYPPMRTNPRLFMNPPVIPTMGRVTVIPDHHTTSMLPSPSTSSRNGPTGAQPVAAPQPRTDRSAIVIVPPLAIPRTITEEATASVVSSSPHDKALPPGPPPAEDDASSSVSSYATGVEEPVL